MGTKTPIICNVALSDLKLNLFVREALNQDHVLYLAGLVEGGIKLPPIQITREKVVVNGRHRVEMYEFLGVKEVEAEILEITDESELIATAYVANVGGSLPPTNQDTEHTIALLLDRGETKKRIGEMLHLPPSMARNYITNVQSRIARARLQKAAASVTEGGLTVAKAAEQHDVDLDKLKDTLSGHRRSHKTGVAEMQRTLTQTYKSVSQKNARLLKGLLEKHSDGDVSEKQTKDIFSHLENLQKNSTRAVSEWKKRFEALNGKSAKKPAE